MNLLKRFSITIQLFLFIAFLLFLVFSITGYIVYKHQKELITRHNDDYLYHHVSSMVGEFDLAYKDMQVEVKDNIKIAHLLFYRNYSGKIKVDSKNKIQYQAVNQITKDTTVVMVDAWTLDGIPIQNNYFIVDKIRDLGPSTVTIFQKIEEGYLRISTNVYTLGKKRAVGTFIPNSSEVIKTIEKGKVFNGRAFVVDDWYTTAYEPIYVDGKIQGILYVGEKESELKTVSKKLKGDRFLKDGYAFIMSDNNKFEGQMLMHPQLEGMNIKTSNDKKQLLLYNSLISNYLMNRSDGQVENESIVRLRLKDSSLGDDVMIYYTYHPLFNYYIGIMLPYNSFVKDEMDILFSLMLSRFSFALLLSIVLLFVYTLFYRKSLGRIIYSLNQLSKGITPKPIRVSGRDEIAKTARILNILTNSNYELIKQVKEIENGKYNVKVRVKSQKDQLAISFNKMAQKLLELESSNRHQMSIREAENDLFDKTRFATNIKDFSAKALNSVSIFLHAPLGAFYIYDSFSKTLKPQATIGVEGSFEMNTVRLGSGIVGQSAEKMNKIQLINNIPVDFYQMKTSIGQAKPIQIVLIPLQLNDQLIGLVELASFEKFKQNELELTGVLKESLAISLSMTQSRLETQSLLEQIQVQTEELRVTNETLEKQAQSLQVSEENLQVQQEELQVTNEELELQAQSLMKSEEELKKQKDALENENVKRKEAQKQLEIAVEKANAATKAKSMFLANMSHEIRTPMNGVIGISDIMSQTKLNVEQQGYIKLISTSANNLLTIINDILDFSKIEAGKIEMERIPFSIKTIIEDTADVLQFKAAEQNDEIYTYIDNEIPLSLIGDPVRLQQVIMNLANNAVKFTESGAITISCELQKVTNNKAHLMFKVVDTGIGISEEGQKKLFKSFTQVDASTTRKFGGTGLGLVISKKLIEKMNGAFGVESVAGEGSTFYFTASFNIDKDQIQQKQIEDRNYQDLNIMIVDNHEPSQMIFAKYLDAKEAKVVSAFGTKQGIELVAEYEKNMNPFDVIFVDYQMPEMNGTQFIKELQSKFINLKTKFVLLTAQQNVVSSDDKKVLEISAYMNKPLKRLSLYNTIEEVVFGISHEVDVIEEKDANKPEDSNVPKLRILLAEDNMINQKVAVYNLEAWGHNVTVADNGEIAFQKYIDGEFDMILMDIQMPVLDGLKATIKIREYEKENNLDPIKITAMTANALKGDDQICFDAGMDAYISKPFKRPDLERVINN
ncbi:MULTISPECIES: Cache 3/Cache 2 fusion domain-containing protein [unclassified Lentimicrobium]|uniref:Cache 3/Cache 2 fusion domain-containing protein n=1 Tax=unclassified Lentimicrobium TaxID=2677434 RepID=UPI0015536997|nr:MULTISPECIES: Cache 3/Cache 2 fusion domain-containing protein [unclassified Lentimicrobium]NPD46466.1 response regulator [Lentimicrobium sp. S6]NPD86600.1 response regulator [Lentimicrobium sp. L6]